jgi:hypothetical protein
VVAEPFKEPIEAGSESSGPDLPLWEQLAREAMYGQLKVVRGREVAWREGEEEPGDLRFLELSLANLNATLAIYHLLKEKLG